MTVLRAAYPAYLWSTLADLVSDYAQWVATEQTDPVTATELLAVHAWRPGAAALQEQVDRDPFFVRRVPNGGRCWPPHAGTSKTTALLWFCLARGPPLTRAAPPPGEPPRPYRFLASPPSQRCSS